MPECDLVHRPSVSVLCMMYKIRCNPLHPLYGALPLPYVPVRRWSHIGTLTRLLAAEPRSIAGFYSLVSISVERSWWPLIRWCGTGGFQEQVQCLFIDLADHSLFISCCFPFLFFHSLGWYCGTDRVFIALYRVFNNNNNKINYSIVN